MRVITREPQAIMVGYLQVFEQPYKAEYIALKADTYARQGDDRGLRTFYETTIRSIAGATTIPGAASAPEQIRVDPRRADSRSDQSEGLFRRCRSIHRNPTESVSRT